MENKKVERLRKKESCYLREDMGIGLSPLAAKDSFPAFWLIMVEQSLLPIYQVTIKNVSIMDMGILGILYCLVICILLQINLSHVVIPSESSHMIYSAFLFCIGEVTVLIVCVALILIHM